MRQEDAIIRYGEVIGYAAGSISRGNCIEESLVKLPTPPRLEDVQVANQVMEPLPPLDGYTAFGNQKIKFLRYDSIFSRILAYSQDFTPLWEESGREGGRLVSVWQHEGMREWKEGINSHMFPSTARILHAARGARFFTKLKIIHL